MRLQWCPYHPCFFADVINTGENLDQTGRFGLVKDAHKERYLPYVQLIFISLPKTFYIIYKYFLLLFSEKSIKRREMAGRGLFQMALGSNRRFITR